MGKQKEIIMEKPKYQPYEYDPAEPIKSVELENRIEEEREDDESVL